MGGPNLNISIKAVAIRGSVTITGLLQGAQATIDVPALLAKQARIIGMQVGSQKDFEAMNRAIESSDLHPVVDRVFPTVDIQVALRSLEAGSHFGKVYLTFSLYKLIMSTSLLNDLIRIVAVDDLHITPFREVSPPTVYQSGFSR